MWSRSIVISFRAMLAGLVGLSAVAAFVPATSSNGYADDPFLGDFGDSFSDSSTPGGDVRSFFRAALRVASASNNNDSSAPAATTNSTDTSVTDDCSNYWARFFHTVGHPVNATHIRLNSHGLKEICTVLRALGIIAQGGGGGGGGDAAADLGRPPNSDSGTTVPSHGGSLTTPAQGPDLDTTRGTTVREPSRALIQKLQSMVGGNSHGDDDLDDDDHDHGKTLFDKIQDYVNRKLDISPTSSPSTG